MSAIIQSSSNLRSLFADILQWRAYHEPDKKAYFYLTYDETSETSLSYAELDWQARRIAASLQAQVSPGDRVLLLYPPGLDYVAAIFGCFYAGVVAVPAYPPRANHNLYRLEMILEDAQVSTALISSPVLSLLEHRFAQNPLLQKLSCIVSDTLSDELVNSWKAYKASGESLALLQYTSGSTGNPKGVMITHNNLIYNMIFLQDVLKPSIERPIVSWLPPYHDMGLGKILGSCYQGVPAVLMSPAVFLQQPLRWLRAISHYRAEISSAPNFAFELCTQKVSPEMLETLDLSTWTLALTGAEPIRHETLERFACTFAPCGFRKEAFYPCYGLAEATLFVTGGSKTDPPHIRSFSVSDLEQGRAVAVGEEQTPLRQLVGCGRQIAGQQLLIVDPETRIRCSPGQIGEIWVSGPNVALGYWQRPQETSETFQGYLQNNNEGPFLRTGDLGFLDGSDDGELFVTGRIKDVIIIRGRNLYPQDIEAVAEQCHPVLRQGSCAAFSIPLAATEGLVIVQEVERSFPQWDKQEVVQALRRAVTIAFDVEVHAIALIRIGSIFKTSSGKIQRQACKQAFLSQCLQTLHLWVHEEPQEALLSSLSDQQTTHAGGADEKENRVISSPIFSFQEILARLKASIAVFCQLDPESIDPGASLANYGLDSLTAIRLSHDVSQYLEHQLSPTIIYEHSSIEELARAIAEEMAQKVERDAIVSPVVLISREKELSLSFAQERLWFLDQISFHDASYTIPVAFCLSGLLHVDKLERSLTVITQRHEALRTIFSLTQEGRPVQILLPALPMAIPLIDLRGSQQMKHNLVQRLIQQEIARPFDLTSGPLLRVFLFRVDEQEHVLLCTMHHIVTDGWSMSVLMRELSACYQACLEGTSPRLPDLPFQYVDYAYWQRAWLQGEVLQSQLAYWRRQLAGAPVVLNLPLDHPRPAVQTFAGAQQDMLLPANLLQELKALSQREGVTLFMTLLAAFQVLLLRYTGQDDLVVGTPIANRTRQELEGLIGFFVNTLALRVDLSGHPTFKQVLQRVRKVCLGAYTHQDIPFEKVVEALEPERDLSHAALFQVMLILQNTPQEQGKLAGVRLTPLTIESVTSKFDLTFTLIEMEAGLQCSLEYSTELFEAGTITRMLEHWHILLQGIVDTPHAPISDLSLLTAAEREFLLVQWNATQRDFPRDRCIHRLFEEQALRTPDAVALVFEEQMLTYAELNREANLFASHLQALGIGPEKRVGICMERGIELVVGLLAVLKAGGAYVPLDPAYPAERLAYMVQDAQIALILTRVSLLERLPSACPGVFCVDRDWSPAGEGPQELRVWPGQSDQMAYLIYTSGSTGRPKGVMGTHRASLNRFHWMWQRYPFGPAEVCCQKTNLSFVDAVWEIFGPLLQGVPLVIMADEVVKDPSRLCRLLERQAVTRIVLVPSLLRVLLEDEQALQRQLHRLTYWVSSGESLPLEVARRFRQCLPDKRLINLYGSSEVTADVTCYEVAPGEMQSSVPIGRPIANTQVYVLDSTMQLVPIGVPGEIYIGGANVTHGYWQRADLTAERFLPDPFSQQPGTRLYRTADLARYRRDGTLEFLGRIDQQVKIRGYRIEPGEIEAALRTHQGVQEVVVLVREEMAGERQLVAYLVGGPEESLRSSDLRSYLQDHLPAYMIPSAFVLLDTLPLTPNGKIDRQALPLPQESQDGEPNMPEEARSPLEELLVELWREILGRRHVGISENFFALGGHSLLAMQLMTRMRALLGVEVPLRAMFETPTVAGIAQQIERALRKGEGVQIPQLLARERPVEIPLSFAQQRLWFLDQLDPQNVAYNMPSALRLNGMLSVHALEQSLLKLVQRHETLRTIFPLRKSGPVQLILEPDPVRLPLLDLQGFIGEQQEACMRQLLQQEIAQPFDLQHGPLWRVLLLRLEEQQHVLLVTIHHSIADGWSMGVLIREISHLYQAVLSGEPPHLPSLPIQYADYALWQRGWLQEEAIGNQLRYWQEQLAGAPALLKLPTDHPRPAMQRFVGAQQRMCLSAELLQELKVLSQREGVTLFMTLLAAFQVLLLRHTGQEDLAVGIPIANRSRQELEGLIGFFVNTLALRTDLSGHPSFRQVLQRVREVALQAYAHQDVPFEKVVETLELERFLSYTPLFQVFFSLQNMPMSELELAGLSWQTLEVEQRTARFDLSLVLTESAQGLVCNLEYNTDLFEVATISRLLSHWQTLLEEIVLCIDRPIGQIPLLTTDEREQQLLLWNATDCFFPAPYSLAQLFEQQVERTPDAVALICERQQVTYRVLDQHANRVAHYLCRQGVGPDQIVGVAIERSLELVVALLGILKAGGAYLPLDPNYPSERLAYMLEDAHTALLLTQSTLSARLPETAIPVLCLDQLWETSGTEPDGPLAISQHPEQLAYVIYTSGSTGRPKGTLITQRGICNSLQWMQETYQLTERDCILQKTSLSFDPSVWELFWPLLTGARLVLARPEGQADHAYLFAVLAQEEVTTLNFAPSELQLFVEEPDWEQAWSVRRVMCGGEALPAGLQARFSVQRNARLSNLYGPTEATIEASFWPCEARGQGIVPIGRPIHNVNLYVLDGYQEPVPIGVVGELYIGGIGLARGYHQRPDLTAERFVPHPFSQEQGQRLYRTGDLVRYRADGALMFHGRIDEQVKLRGFRIELGEIEAILRAHPSVRDALVMLHEARALVGYVTTHEQVSSSQLQEHLRAHVPDYMVPPFIIMLEAFPLTRNGKVDRHALPTPEWTDLRGSGAYSPPRTPLEELLAQIWAELLQVTQVGIHDNFFELGGHSLLATQLVARIRQCFQCELPVRIVFEQPTIASLATVLKSIAGEDQASEMPSIQPMSRAQKIPLSFSQERLWFLDQLAPQSATYNMPVALQLTGPLSLEALEQSLTRLVQRHETLRTCFQSEESEPVQWISEPWSVRIALVDLQSLSSEQHEEYVSCLFQQEMEQPFELQRAPLWRVCLLRLSQQKHALLLTMHHSIADGWSMGVLTREISSLYKAALTNETAFLPTLPVQYADYALWQRQWFQGEVLERQLAYWQQQMAGAPALLKLPTDHPRPAVQTFAGAQQAVCLSPDLLRELKVLSQREGVTFFMTLLAAFQVLLLRYSGQEDIVVGTPIANRRWQEVEGLIGFFANTLALRTDLSGNPDFRQLLQRVREVSLQAYAHQDLPFEKLVSMLQVERSMRYAPLFQVLFTLQNMPLGELELAGLSWQPLELKWTTAKFDLSLVVSESAQGLEANLEYNTDLFEATTISRLLKHWQVLLEEIVREVNQPIGQIPLLTAAEREQQHVIWNATCQAIEPTKNLPLLFEQQVARTPDAVAVIFEHASLTYRELDRRANQVGRYLQSLGVGPDQFVGVYMERSQELLVALLGILKAGGAYLPLDLSYPGERLAYLIRDAGPRLLLTESHLVTQLLPTTIPMLCLDTDWGQIAARSTDTPPHTLIQPQQLAYLLYTSGSTGRPKGTMITHQGLTNYLLWAIQTYDVASGAGTPLHSPLGFDLSVTSLFPSLLVGQPVWILPADQGEALVQALQQGLHFSLVKLTPAHLTLLNDWLTSAQAATCSRALVIGGEALSGEQVRFWQENAPEIRLINEYGPTETVVGCCVYEVSAYEQFAGEVPIGRPIANMQLYVLDARMEPIPVGVVGELYIGGVGLARGYHRRADLTAERFVPHPWSQEPGQRLYRTGDLVRYRVDGILEFLGRIDEQVKLRGFRIEPGEIEAILRAHPDVRDALVLLQEEPEGQHYLVAYIVAQTESLSVNIAQLQTYVRSYVPDYMVPSGVVQLEAFPLTAHGKVDRRALPAPAWNDSENAQSYMAPRTALEELLTQIWAELLHQPQVGIHDNFFVLGGHSLLATRLVARIRQRLHLELSIRTLFETPDIASLARILETSLHDDRLSQLPPLEPMSRDEEIPLSFAQERLWFLDRLDPQSAAYNVPAVLSLTGSLSLKTLEQSLQALVHRHEILRTTFHIGKTGPVQHIGVPGPVQLALVDIQSLSGEQRDVQVHHLVQQEAERPFDLQRGPLWRVHLLRLHEREHLLFVTLHHSIADGWSMGVLIREISQLYRKGVSGEAVSLPPLPIQYADYTLWQRKWLQGETLEQQLAYWQQHLSGVSAVLNLPLDYPRPAVQTFVGARQNMLLPSALLQDLKMLSQREGVTLFMTLLAAFQVLLLRYTGQDDLVVGTPIANRTRQELEGLIGFFVNTLALRTDLSGNPSFQQLLRRVRDVALQAYVHQDVPFEKVVEALHVERSMSYSPLFQVLFILQNTPAARLELPDLVWSLREGEQTTAKFDLSLELQETEQGLLSIFEYNTDLFDKSTIQQLLQHWHTLLQEIVAYPQRSLSAFSLLAEEERQTILFAWNDTGSQSATREQPIHSLFEAQCMRTPDVVAAIFVDQSITYAELNRRANQLAFLLMSSGVGPEVLVGLCLERSLETLIGLLAILKAGGVCVPLDPSYPPERLAFMLQDAGLALLLTQQPFLPHLVAPPALHILCLDRPLPDLQLQPTTNPGVNVQRDHLAYVLYTSGSTGQPKGVEMRHGALANLFFWQQQRLPLVAGEIVLQFAPLSFDVSFQEVFTTWQSGGTLLLLSSELWRDPRAILQLLSRHQVQRIYVPYVELQQLAQAAVDQPTSNWHVRTIVSAGEQLLLSQPIVSWLCRLEGCVLANQYGPTECHVVTAEDLHGDPEHWPLLPPIGRPISNAQIYLLDPVSLEPVPAGVSGELFIGGEGLARGYLHRPDLTAERFVPDPFRACPGARLYRTGDQARYLRDGRIEYQGRFDQQVKLRGFRVELGEIEAALQDHPALREAVVTLRDDKQTGKYLVAYIVLESREEQPTAQQLQHFLHARLPDYMIPALFVMLENLPRTPSGKIDRRILPAPDRGQLRGEREVVAPQTPLQEALVQIWLELLPQTHIGIHDNFFELGGHSLLAMQLIVRVQRLLAVEIPVRNLFERPTIAELVLLIQHLQREKIQQIEHEDLEQLLAEVECLSDDEILASFRQEL